LVLSLFLIGSVLSRLSGHNLLVQRMYHDRNRRPNKLRICDKCDWHTVRDEEHIFLGCPHEHLNSLHTQHQAVFPSQYDDCPTCLRTLLNQPDVWIRNRKTVQAEGGCRKLLDGICHMSDRLKCIYLEFGILTSRTINWCIPTWDESGREGVVPRWGFSLFRGVPIFSGPLSRDFKYIIGILSLSSVDCHLFWANWVKGGVCRHVQKSEAHALGCRPRGESSQWSSNSLQFFRTC
jgi:hypothetical protein